MNVAKALQERFPDASEKDIELCMKVAGVHVRYYLDGESAPENFENTLIFLFAWERLAILGNQPLPFRVFSDVELKWGISPLDPRLRDVDFNPRMHAMYLISIWKEGKVT